MKKLLITLCALLSVAVARADEGMWLLALMQEQHLADSLRRAGLLMPTDEVYSETSTSLRDVVGIFGSGCTGEVVSHDGLVLTNNHCGFGVVHDISTMEHNYLQDGFFAHSRSEELQVPHLSFTFVKQIIDVTVDVEKAAAKQKADAYQMQSADFLEPLAQRMLAKSKWKKAKGMTVRIVPFFGGNRFYLFYEQEYTDVRLVVNPPQQVAQFGFNQDNWIWPRHNCDFMMFRIYADANGQPADYSAANVPLHCERALPVSLKGIDKDDYTMIMGFPGSTSRYLTRSEVDLRTGSINYPINLAGEAELTYMKALMDADKEASLKYADQYMSLGNVVKNFGGMNESVKKTGLVAIKEREEAAFRAFAAQSRKPEYADIIERIADLVKAYADTIHDFNLFNYTVRSQELWDMADTANVDVQYDRGKMGVLLPIWQETHRLGLNVASLEGLESKADVEKFLDNIYADDEALAKYVEAIKAYANVLNPALMAYQRKRAELDRIYVRGLSEMYAWTKAPDANFTLRMTYGHVCDLQPRNAVRYDWQTTLDGMIEKENPRDPDYVVDARLKSLYEAKDFGRYALPSGELPTCFLSNNDITGGNSGSPVLNADGALIGLAFDGNIESLSSDLRFNPQLQRCICVDIRYVLWVCDIYGGAKYAVDELNLQR